jgi:hypothetical protein
MGDKPVKRDILDWVFLGVILLLLCGIFSEILTSDSGHSPRFFAEMDARVLVRGIRAYSSEHENLPSGDNATILAILQGPNPRQSTFFRARPGSVNTQGELVDPWGTPYRFDLTDPKNPRVWSCGKDRRDNGGTEGSDDITSWR